jgi:hypothetical protein
LLDAITVLAETLRFLRPLLCRKPTPILGFEQAGAEEGPFGVGFTRH